MIIDKVGFHCSIVNFNRIYFIEIRTAMVIISQIKRKAKSHLTELIEKKLQFDVQCFILNNCIKNTT